jgi:hypothetical protein
LKSSGFIGYSCSLASICGLSISVSWIIGGVSYPEKETTAVALHVSIANLRERAALNANQIAEKPIEMDGWFFLFQYGPRMWL